MSFKGVPRPIGDTERAFQIRINSKLSVDFCHCGSRFWAFWAH